MHVVIEQIPRPSDRQPRVRGWVDGVRVTFRLQDGRRHTLWRCEDHHAEVCEHVEAVMGHLSDSMLERLCATETAVLRRGGNR